MKVPMCWLSDFVDTGLSAQELAYRMTMAGLEAEKIEEIGDGWDNVYVGLVEKVERHPDADRLVLATVKAGEHELTVVTGAPNIAAGQRVALALAGARLIDGHSDTFQYKTLKPGMIRGIRSEGMVCSEKELGISDEHEGILVLPEDAPVGAPLKEYLGDQVIEFEITPNLVHAFSVLGIAREAAALTDRPLHQQPAVDLAAIPASLHPLSKIDAGDLCARFIAVKIEGVTVGPAPEWMQQRLKAAGLRPVNNLVDVTNYVMLEMGQPLHAYDQRDITGPLNARMAAEDERMETLDHVERTLTADMLVIADDSRAVGVAGVMGGVNSEVRDETTDIVLEGANFEMTSIRHTARALKLRSDASARFERGIDPNLTGPAVARATRLILEICPGSVATGITDVYPHPVKRRTISFAFSRIEHLLGIGFSEDRVLDVLGRLDMHPDIIDVDGVRTLTVSPPTYRNDVTIREDVIEEVARMIGYEALPETLPHGGTPIVTRDRLYLLQEEIRAALVGAGAYEAVTYVTVGDADLAPFVDAQGSIGATRQTLATGLIRLINPLQMDRPYMRPTLLPSLLQPAIQNLKHESGVRFFEMSRGFLPTSPDELPEEINLLAIAFAGTREPLSRFGGTGNLDFFDVKGAVEETMRRIGIRSWNVEPELYVAFHPSRSAAICHGDTLLGRIGELRPDLAAKLGFDVERVAVAELNVDELMKLVPERPDQRRVEHFLPVEQDFAIVVDDNIPASEVEATLRAAAGPLASGFVLFDVYSGAQIGDGKKSLAYRVTFTAPDRALTDSDLGKVRSRIEKSLKQRINGVLRA